jgi:N-acetylglutamate synthase-like GNAT family acetyltransferase
MEKTLFDKNIKNKFSYLPSNLSGMEVNKVGNLLVINSHLDSDMFNIICSDGTVDRNIIRSSIEYFKSKKLPYAFWIGFEDDPDWLEKELISLGLITDEIEWAMSCDLTIHKPDTATLTYDIRNVSTEKEVQDIIKVIKEILPKHEHKAIQSFYEQSKNVLLSKDSALRFFLGYDNGHPISLSSLYCDESLASIFDVIVLPDMRGKSLGKTMTLVALSEAVTLGYDTCILTATNNAKYVYEKLGFKTFKTMKVYRKPVTQ